MTVTTTTNPASEPSQLWPLDLFVRANWATPLVIRHTYQTVVTNALSDAEQRRGQVYEPSTLITYPFMHWDDMHTIQMFLMRIGIASTSVPIWMDKVTLGPVSAEIEGFYTLNTPGAFFIRNSSSSRLAIRHRIKANQRVLLWQKSTDSILVAEVTSTSVTEGQGVTYQTDVDFASLTGTWVVFPLVESRLVFQTSIQLHSSMACEGSVDFASSTNRISSILENQGGIGFLDEIAGGDTLEGYQFYDDKPIFESPISWGDSVTMSFQRSGQFSPSGVDDLPTVYGSRPRVGYELTVRALTREKAWKFKRLFDWSLGRCFSWWMVSPVRSLELLSVTGVLVAIAQDGATNDWNYRPYIALVGYDGTIEVRKIVSVAPGAGFDVITVDLSFTLTLSEVRKVAVARNMRFATDELVEVWSSTETCDFPVQFIEVIDESDVTILRPGGYSSELDSPNAIPLLDTWSPDGCSTVL
ncbi:MAG: hypothetical protein COA69_09380 [Robiginitomaculum sp.]|nr:MAG: hypothetical protein COA69_09380 [Robiginitomaculum sp.]